MSAPRRYPITCRVRERYECSDRKLLYVGGVPYGTFAKLRQDYVPHSLYLCVRISCIRHARTPAFKMKFSFLQREGMESHSCVRPFVSVL